MIVLFYLVVMRPDRDLPGHPEMDESGHLALCPQEKGFPPPVNPPDFLTRQALLKMHGDGLA